MIVFRMKTNWFSAFTVFLFATQGLLSAPRDYLESGTAPLVHSAYSFQLPYPLLSAPDSPGASSLFEHPGFLVQGAYSNDFYSISVPVFLPGSHGVLGIMPVYVEGQDYMYAGLPLSFGRKINPYFSLGFTTRLAYTAAPDESYFSLGVDPSFAFRMPFNAYTKSGIGFGDSSFFIQTNQLALHTAYGDSNPRPSLQGGHSASLYKKDDMSLQWNTFVYGIGNFSTVPWGNALRFQWKFVGVHLGYMHTNENDLMKGLSAGADIFFTSKKSQFALSYAFLPALESDADALHTFSAGMVFGLNDTSPPVVTILPDFSSFSPNSDGKKDYTVFQIQVRDKSPLESWILEITDAEGNAVRTFARDEREYRKKFSLWKSLGSFFLPRESLIVPEKIRWDGTGEWKAISEAASSVSQNPLVADGVYSYAFRARDVYGNESTAARGQIILDTIVPTVQLVQEATVFSPNKDGRADTITVDQMWVAGAEDEVNAAIISESGQRIAEYKWIASEAPSVFSWDGNYPDGEAASAGLYFYEVTVRDKAGNESTARTNGFVLSRSEDSVELRLSKGGFSPAKSVFVMEPIITRRNGIIGWEVFISSKLPEPKNLRAALVKQWKGVDVQSMPTALEWDGKNDAGALQADGRYYAMLQVSYEDGNQPLSKVYSFVLDNTPPEASVVSDQRIFSPDGDGENDEQIFRLMVVESSPLEKYELVVNEIQYNDNGILQKIPFKKFSGEHGYPEKIFWDGKGDSSRLVESVTRFEYQLFAKDIYGNSAYSSVGRFETDILVLPTERGLKIRLSNIEFAVGKAIIGPDGKKVLDKLALRLARYSNYKILITGHTDSDGSDDFNLRLSELRAKAVLQYLVEKGIDSRRLSYQGLGEVEPLLPNDSWYNKSRNRRVEFLLIK